MSRNFLLFGESGVGKSYFAGSNGSGWFAEFDPGSFERSGLLEESFSLHKYHSPLVSLLDTGRLSGAGIAHKLEGWNELLWQFVADYIKALDGPDQTFILDTSTRLWLLVRNAFFQRVQQEKDDKARDRLSRLEYQEPNSQMSQIVEAAKIKDKTLIMIAHEGEVYENDRPTGRFKPDGFKELNNIADCTLRFTVRNKSPMATIVKAGTGGLELIGLEVESPTLLRVNEIIDAATVLRRNRVQIPRDVETIIAMASAYA